MLFFVTTLPNSDLTERVKTLVTVQVRIQKFGELKMKPFVITAESKADWAALTESFLSRRMSAFFTHMLFDPVLPGEIRVRHFFGQSRKNFMQKLRDSDIVHDNVCLKQFYFSYNRNCHSYITNMHCQQHIDLTIKLEEKNHNRKRKLEQDDDILVIKLEPDF